MSEAITMMEVRRADGRASIVDIKGDITSGSEDALMDAYGRATANGVRTVVLNFSGLEYMNSGGIGLLVTLLVRANRQHERLLACGLTEHYRQILELTRLDDAIAVHDTEEDALAAAGAS